MSNRILPADSINPNSTIAPGILVAINNNPQLIVSGVQTNIIGLVGTGTWGNVNSATAFSGPSGYSGAFGDTLTNKYDMGTFVAAASLQGSNASFIGVRVTDGTDLPATSNLLDSLTTPAIGAVLTGFYSGTTGNKIKATISLGATTGTFTLRVSLPGGFTETFANISGSGATFWQNLVNAVNQGLGLQGPSKLVIASLSKSVGGITVTNPGTGYTSIPSITLTGGGGTGATASAIMKALASTVGAGGSGYSVGDTITLAGGTSTQAIVLTVSTVSSGAVTGVTITTAGKYSVLPTNPASQASSSGAGTGATFNITSWGVDSILVTAGGMNYTTPPTVGFTGGAGSGAAATATIGSVNTPALSTYSLTGGTNGITGVTATTLLGTDSSPGTGLYALRGSGASIVALVDADNSATYSDQVAFGQTEGAYMMIVDPAGHTVAQMVSAKNTAGIADETFKFCGGDWIYFLDTANGGIERVISPQGFFAGRLANLAPQESCLNKPMNGILNTQKTYSNQIYSDADIVTLMENGIDVISKPSPRGQVFTAQTGKNGSINPARNNDPLPRMTYFMAESLDAAASLGTVIGELQTPDTRKAALDAIVAFLQNLKSANQIKNFKVVLDDSNNPENRVELGFMAAQVQVQLYSVVIVFLIDLTVGTASIQ